jgi:hypothetical protein
MTRNNIMQEVVTQRRSSDDGVTPITRAGVQDELLIDQKSHALQNLTQSYGGYTMIYYDILRATQWQLRIDWTPCPAMVCTCQKAAKHSPT